MGELVFFDLATIDRSAVGAAEIDDPESAITMLNPRVVARHLGRIDDDEYPDLLVNGKYETRIRWGGPDLTELDRPVDRYIDRPSRFIDIADVDIGNNIGARLQADQAEADKRVAQALAEKRRAMAVATEQEFKAQVVENRAKVVLAEAEIPKAMAHALSTGNLGVMDLYRLRNIEADTKMRGSIGGEPRSGPEEDKT